MQKFLKNSNLGLNGLKVIKANLLFCTQNAHSNTRFTFFLLHLFTNTVPGTYVAFVVDNTGSMSNEMADVKVWMEKCTKGMYEDCKNIPTGGWILSPFNDPGQN